MVHIPPTTHYLASLSVGSSLPWWKALAELVDNSLDAGATRVVIDVANRVVTVSDDGLGCEDITALFRLGDHKRRKSSKRGIGMYGVGAKDAWLSCADTMKIVSQHGKYESTMEVNYIDWMKNDWNAPDPVVVEKIAQPGTTITLPLRNGKNIPADDAFKSLSFAFTPAIGKGIQIVKSIRGKKTSLLPFEMPSRNDVVQSEFEIDGKSVKIDIGILPEGVSIENGPFWLIYGHRIIEPTSMGAGKKYSVRRMAGTITLGDGWSLGKNKDAITENQERLAEAIFVRIEPTLAKADQLAETIESSALRSELTGILNEFTSNANKKGRAKRNRTRAKKGSVNPASTKRKVRKAREVHEIGDIDGPFTGSRGAYVLDWCEIDENSIGMFDRTGMRVSLNVNNGLISAAKSSSNRPALAACAVALIADHCCRYDENGNGLLKFDFKNFSEAMGAIVKDYSEGKQDAKAAI